MNSFKRWFIEGRYFFMFGAVIILSFNLDNFKPIPLEHVIRFYGLALQLAGAWVIIVSLKEKAMLFESSGPFKLLWNYLKRFPLLQQEKKHHKMTANAGGYAVATAEISGIVEPNENFADIIRYIKVEIELLKTLIRKTNEALAKESEKLNETISQVKVDSNQKTEQLELLLRQSNTSNIWMDFFGVSCVIYGLILATIPDYFCNWFFGCIR